MRAIRVLVVDARSPARGGLRARLEELDGIEVVGDASNRRSALGRVRSESPDLAVIDLTVQVSAGLETASAIADASPATRVIVVSEWADAQPILAAIDAGAAGCISKDASPSELDFAIRAVVRGDAYLSPAVSRYVIDAYRRLGDERTRSGARASRRTERARLAQLTPRQREVLKLLAEGSSSQRMAQLLSLSVKTVETHRAQLMGRLGIRDVPGLVRFAIRAGLVRADEA